MAKCLEGCSAASHQRLKDEGPSVQCFLVFSACYFWVIVLPPQTKLFDVTAAGLVDLPNSFWDAAVKALYPKGVSCIN